MIQGLVEDQYKVFPHIKQVAVFCTRTVQLCNFVAKSCLLHVRLYKKTLIYVSVDLETSVSLYRAFHTLNGHAINKLIAPPINPRNSTSCTRPFCEVGTRLCFCVEPQTTTIPYSVSTRVISSCMAVNSSGQACEDISLVLNKDYDPFRIIGTNYLFEQD